MQKNAENEAIIRRSQRFAASVDLETELKFQTAVQEQLDRLVGSQLAKRHSTVLALAEAHINPGITTKSVFSRKDTISRRVFYDPKKDWFHNPVFREVLENVKALHMRWDRESELRQTIQRQHEWKEKMFQTADTMIERAQEMMNKFSLEEVELAGDEEGETIIVKPARWSWDTVPRLVTAADKIARLALDMHTDHVQEDIEAKVAEVDVDELRQSMKDKLHDVKTKIRPLEVDDDG